MSDASSFMAVMGILRSVTADGYHLYGTVPDKKRACALRYYGVPADEPILALIDTSVFGKAKTGVAFTPTGLFWKNDWTNESERNHVTWDQLSQAETPITTTMFELILGTGQAVNLSGAHIKKKDLEYLLNALIAQHRKTPLESAVPDSETSASVISGNQHMATTQDTGITWGALLVAFVICGVVTYGVLDFWRFPWKYEATFFIAILLAFAWKGISKKWAR